MLEWIELQGHSDKGEAEYLDIVMALEKLCKVIDSAWSGLVCRQMDERWRNFRDLGGRI